MERDQGTEPDCAPVIKAYRLIYHGRGNSMTMNVWRPAQLYLRMIATVTVRKAASRYSIPQKTWSDRIDDLEGELIAKLVQKRLGDPLQIGNMEALLRTAALRALLTLLRAIKSPMAGAMVTDPGGVDDTDHPEAGDEIRDDGEEDTFSLVRVRMGRFRFREHSLARDAMLAIRLATGKYMGPGFLRFVPTQVRVIVYNAAVVDINTAIMKRTEDARDLEPQTAAA